MKWRAFSWNHRPDASMVYFHYGSLNSVKAFMMAERETCECICSYVLFFFSKAVRTLTGKPKKSPTNPRISSFFESQDQESLWSILCISKQKQNKNLQQICLTRVETENSLSFLKRGLTDLSPFGAIQKQLLHLTSNTML